MALDVLLLLGRPLLGFFTESIWHFAPKDFGELKSNFNSHCDTDDKIF